MNTMLHIVRPDDVPAPSAAEIAAQMCAEWALPAVLPWMTREFEKLLQQWPAELLQEAISRTARAPRPSWAYFSAILRNWAAAGVNSPAMLAAIDARHRSQPGFGRTVTAQQYTQREYTEAELDAVSGDLIAEARAYAGKGV